MKKVILYKVLIAAVLALALLLLPVAPASVAHAESESSGPIWLDEDFKLQSDMSFINMGFIVLADDITINLNGHTITGSGTEMGLGISVSGRSGVTIKNGTVTGFAYGVLLSGSDNNVIKGITATNNFYNGIFLFNDSDNNQVIGCTCDSNDNGFGIIMNWGSDYNEVKHCTVINNGMAGIFIGGGPGPPTPGSNNNTIKDTVCSNNAGPGIFVLASSNTIIKDNVINNNAGAGILVMGSTGNFLCNNIINGNGLNGIALFEGADNNEVRDNNISNNLMSGILIGWPPFPGPHIPPVDNTIIDNKLSGNIVLDIFDQTTDGGTAGTANFYKDNKGDSSNPSGLVH